VLSDENHNNNNYYCRRYHCLRCCHPNVRQLLLLLYTANTRTQYKTRRRLRRKKQIISRPKNASTKTRDKHISRMCVYATGRINFTISTENNERRAALALSLTTHHNRHQQPRFFPYYSPLANGLAGGWATCKHSHRLRLRVYPVNRAGVCVRASHLLFQRIL